MIISVEMKSLHDVIMLDSIIDMWKSKWKADEAELKGDNDDAEVESEDCSDEPEAETDAEYDPKAYEEALDKLKKAIRDCGGDDISFTHRRTTGDHLK